MKGEKDPNWLATKDTCWTWVVRFMVTGHDVGRRGFLSILTYILMHMTFVTLLLACLYMTADLTNRLITAHANQQASPSSSIFMRKNIQWVKVTHYNNVDVTNPACICPFAIVPIYVCSLKWLLARWLHMQWLNQDVFGSFLARQSHVASSAPVVIHSPL